MNDEAHYKLLKLLEQNPQATQRELATALGVSLGKVNYCLKALIDKGHVKAENFRNSDNKATATNSPGYIHVGFSMTNYLECLASGVGSPVS